MKTIQVVKEDKEQKLFEIKGYSFIEKESEAPLVPIYKVIIKQHFDSPLDVRYWLEAAVNGAQFLSDVPSELTVYIKNYEENMRFQQLCLFHDLRTKYIDFLLYDESNLKNNVLLIGYTLLEHETCIALKGFSLPGLTEPAQKLLDYCHARQIAVESEQNLRWIQLEQSMLPDININRSAVFDSFLKKTLQAEYCDLFIQAFRAIDAKGYLDHSFYSKSVSIHGNETVSIGKVKHFTKYFSPFWKTEISVKDVSRTVLCLHDELLDDESVDKMVYTVKPNLMKYYQLHWFEDFCSEIIKNIQVPEFKIIHSYSGRRFNFYQNGCENDIREIDMVIEVEANNSHKIIAIECKKTLTNDEIKGTNKKIRDKILKARQTMIDAYVHIGCFNNGVEFDKKIEGTHKRYKQGVIQLKNEAVYDAPYFAFSTESIYDLRMKACYVIKKVFEQW